jgi:hypothetical protein
MWTGNYDQIKDHLREKHSDKCYDYGGAELRTVKGFHSVSFYCEFIFAFNDVFIQRFIRKDDILYVSVCYVGHTENAVEYKYKIEFVNEDNTAGVSVKRLATAFNNVGQHLLRPTNSFKLHYDEVHRLTNEEGDLKYKIQIRRVGD